jgi:UrcA family protein
MIRQLLAFSVLALASGMAAADADTRSIAVRYEVASLAHDAGARSLHGRLEAAARHVCGVRDEKDLRARRAWQECYDAALADAIAHVGDDRLVAVNGKRRGSRARGG